MNLAELFQMISTGGALAFAIWMIWLFLSEKIVPRGRLDDQKDLTQEALDGWKAANSANERLADAWEARNAAEARLDERLK
jgi:hypothetical protein